MGDAPITPQVRAFIAERIDSVMALEVLLLLAGSPQRRWTADALAQELRIDPAWTAAQLPALASGGLLATDGGNGEFWYEPHAQELRQTVDDLARAYADRRVTVIGLIFSKPTDNIRTFADAFRIRKDKSDG